MDPVHAAAVGLCTAWTAVGGSEEARKLLWKRIAYATRYGNSGLEAALDLDTDQLSAYIEATSQIVEEENRGLKK